MALGLQSLYRWDNLIQSEVHEIAISPQGNFFAVAASQGGVFVFDAGTGQAIHAIQLRINEQPLSCLWSSHPVEGENTTELELFLGTSAGIVASVRLDAMKSLGRIQWVTDRFPGPVVRLAVCVPDSLKVLLAVAFGEHVEIWHRLKGQVVWSKGPCTTLQAPDDIVENITFISATTLLISYGIKGLFLWDTEANRLVSVEGFNPPLLLVGGQLIPVQMKTDQTDIWLDRGLLIRTTEQYLLIYRIFANAANPVVTLIHSAPLVSHCDVRFLNHEGTTIVLQPDRLTRLRACCLSDIRLDQHLPANEELLDHSGRRVGHVATFSSSDSGELFVVTGSKAENSRSPWVRIELWGKERQRADVQEGLVREVGVGPQIFPLPIRLKEGIDARHKLQEPRPEPDRWPVLASLLLCAKIALTASTLGIIWLLVTAPNGGTSTDLMERNPQLIVADGVRETVFSAGRFLTNVLDGLLHGVHSVFLWIASRAEWMRRLVFVYCSEVSDEVARVSYDIWRRLAFFFCGVFADRLGERCSTI